MTQTTTQPAAKIKDGSITATIWANDGNNGRKLYSVEFARSYLDESEQWQESRSFSRNELLRVARLANEAYGRIQELRRAEINQEE